MHHFWYCYLIKCKKEDKSSFWRCEEQRRTRVNRHVENIEYGLMLLWNEVLPKASSPLQPLVTKVTFTKQQNCFSFCVPEGFLEKRLELYLNTSLCLFCRAGLLYYRRIYFVLHFVLCIGLRKIQVCIFPAEGFTKQRGRRKRFSFHWQSTMIHKLFSCSLKAKQIAQKEKFINWALKCMQTSFFKLKLQTAACEISIERPSSTLFCRRHTHKVAKERRKFCPLMMRGRKQKYPWTVISSLTKKLSRLFKIIGIQGQRTLFCPKFVHHCQQRNNISRSLFWSNFGRCPCLSPQEVVTVLCALFGQLEIGRCWSPIEIAVEIFGSPMPRATISFASFPML